MGACRLWQTQEDIAWATWNAKQAMELFQRRTAECLIISKYATAPGKYTMEALLMNVQNEFVQSKDFHVGVWVLIGVAIRLALRMGYHRDPKHYSQFSPFEREMRRRIWILILQLDSLTSCQIGLPPMIQDSQCDTKAPRNIFDTEFGPESLQLPPSQPETVMTPMLYTLVKSRIFSVFRSIFNQVSLGRTENHKDILELEQQLQASKATIPPSLQLQPLANSLAVPPSLLMRQFGLELLFHKARCILHRHHMAKSYQNPEFILSRLNCIDSAMSIITLQSTIIKEMRLGGLLYEQKWFLTSIELHDLLLASMVVCLELNCLVSGKPSYIPVSEQSAPKFSKEDMVEAIQNCHSFLEEVDLNLVEAHKATRVLSAMLRKFSVQSHEWKSTHSASDQIQSNSMNSSVVQGKQGQLILGVMKDMANEMSPGGSIQDVSAVENSTIEGINTIYNAPEHVNWVCITIL